MSIEPDDKDWTWVVHTPCPDCGFDPDTVTRDDLTLRMREAAAVVATAVTEPMADIRPNLQTWSNVEYGAHVRDMCDVMRERLALMLAQDEPTFENWDQDAAAAAYADLKAEELADEIDEASRQLVLAYLSVPDEAWDRVGLRSNGAFFTVWTLGLYALHDLNHHAWDVTN